MKISCLGGAFALAMLVSATAAAAEPMTLLCQYAVGDGSLTFRVDAGTGRIEWLSSDGSIYRSAQGRFTENDITFDGAAQADTDTTAAGHRYRRWIAGYFNRLSGAMSFTYHQSNETTGEHWGDPQNLTCRRATQKF